LTAYLRFLLAIFYLFLARSMAHRGFTSVASAHWSLLFEQSLFALLLLIGYAGFGRLLDHQDDPISQQGFPLRKGWATEAGLGLAIGWALALICVLPLALIGGISITLNLQPAAWGWLAVELAFFALLALSEEVAFRGYGFQRFEQALGPSGAALGYAVLYAILQMLLLPGSSRLSFVVSILLGLVLSTAYLRTRALWLSWGLNFAWKASRALLFGLALSGVNSHSSVVQGEPMGPFWLTGGGFGLDGSFFALLALLVAWVAVYRLTRDLDFQYNAPILVPGGLAVDIDAAAKQAHQAAMGEPAAPALIQIMPLSMAPSASTEVILPEQKTP
jgi:membrane protease YdiL (CAAX protease family)